MATFPATADAATDCRNPSPQFLDDAQVSDEGAGSAIVYLNSYPEIR